MICMVHSADFLVWLSNCGVDDISSIGESNVSLVKLKHLDVKVPQRFILLSHAYFTFLKENNLDTQIRHLLATINFENDESVHQVARQIRRIIAQSHIPSSIVQDVFKAYEVMSQKKGGIEVSITVENITNTKKLSQVRTVNEYVSGEAVLLELIRKAYVSFFDAPLVKERHTKKISQTESAVVISVQKVIESDVSGILWTIDPLSDSKNIVIEAVLGRGELVEKGKVVPDHFEFSKKERSLVSRRISLQAHALHGDHGVLKEQILTKTLSESQKITDTQLTRLVNLSGEVERIYYFPQEVSWSLIGNLLYVTHIRPITTFYTEAPKSLSGDTILVGESLAKGIGVGPVRIIKEEKDYKAIQRGDIVVVDDVKDALEPYMRLAVSLVVERNMVPSHFLYSVRSLGVPIVKNVKNARTILKNHETITVYGETGKIQRGSIVHGRVKNEYHTKTKVYLLISSQAQKAVGDGAFFSFNTIIKSVGVHPERLIQEKREAEFVKYSVSEIVSIAQHMYPNPVIVSLSDLTSREYQSLKNGNTLEAREENPKLGHRGAQRHLLHKKQFSMELKSFLQAKEKAGGNVWLQFPFVRTVDEAKALKALINEKGVRRTNLLQFVLPIVTPANIFSIEQYTSVGIDKLYIDADLLFETTFGVDFKSIEALNSYSLPDPVMHTMIKYALETAKRCELEVIIKARNISHYPRFVRELMRETIEGVCVSPESFGDTKHMLYLVEGE